MSATPARATSLRPEVPEPLSDAIARCLEKDPSLRFGTISELANALAPFGPPDAPERIERIERVLERGLTAASKLTLDSASLLTRPNGVRFTPSGLRQRAPTAPDASAVSATRLAATLSPDMLAAQLRPRRLPWLFAVLALGALGGGVVAVLRGQHPPAPVQPASPSVPPVAALARALPAPSEIPAPARTPSANPVASGTSAPPASAPPASAPPASASRPLPSQAKGHAVRAVLHAATPRPTAATPPSSAPSPKPDVAAAWDTNNFGPRQ
jgi:hypothetical protein